MRFRFIDVLVIFQKKINTVLREHLDEFMITYFNNIIVYLNNNKNHDNYIK